MQDLTGARVLDLKGDTLEIKAVFRNADKGSSGLRIRRSDDGTRSLEIRCQGGGVDVFGTRVPMTPEGEEKMVALHVFLDKSIVEVFVNGGRQTAAKVVAPPAGDLGIEAFTDGTGDVDVWRMKSIW
ncbi:MAG: GH32 C-terminal domain-containing protein [Verrucomicrobia bacterium]|nr:GH32 C-terminal domain-containing protein [Verrucomicrobiota bacterium]